MSKTNSRFNQITGRIGAGKHKIRPRNIAVDNDLRITGAVRLDQEMAVGNRETAIAGKRDLKIPARRTVGAQIKHRAARCAEMEAVENNVTGIVAADARKRSAGRANVKGTAGIKLQNRFGQNTCRVACKRRRRIFEADDTVKRVAGTENKRSARRLHDEDAVGRRIGTLSERSVDHDGSAFRRLVERKLRTVVNDERTRTAQIENGLIEPCEIDRGPGFELKARGIAHGRVGLEDNRGAVLNKSLPGIRIGGARIARLPERDDVVVDIWVAPNREVAAPRNGRGEVAVGRGSCIVRYTQNKTFA